MAWFESKKYKQLKEQIKALQSFNINANLNRRFDTFNYFPDWDTATITGKYATSDQIYAVINKIAETSAQIPIYNYINKNTKALNKLKTLNSRQFYTNKGLFDIAVYQTKALKDAPEDDPLSELLENPNEYQSKNEFLIAVYSFYLLNGEAIIYINRLEEDGGANGGKPYDLHILNPANVTIHVSNEFPQSIISYDFIVNGKKILENVQPEDIIHWKRFNPNFSLGGNHLRGLSPLKAGTLLVDELTEADKRSINQLKNGAVPGIVYDKSIGGDELKQDVFDAQKKRFYDFISKAENQGAPFFVGTEKGYLPIGLSAADMKLIELQKIGFKRLCNIYKISDILFNSDVSATESNVREQIKQMYTSACLPMVYAFVNKLNAALTPFYPDVPYYINCDVSAVTELQENIKDMVDAIAALPVSPAGNELRKLLNYDEMDIAWMNEPLIKSGYSFYSDVNIPPVDPALLDTAI